MGKTYENGRKKHETRADKKRKLAPTVRGRTLATISTLSYTLETPQKTVGEFLVRAALQSTSCIAKCHRWARFDFRMKNFFLNGHLEYTGYKPSFTSDPDAGRMPDIKFHKPQYDVLTALAFSLDCRPATAAGLLVELALQDRQIVMALIRKYAPKHMDDRRRSALEKWLRGLQLNLDGSEYIAWLDLLHAIVDTGRAIGELAVEYFSDLTGIDADEPVHTG